MNELIFFIAGCLFSRYILMVFDYLLEWFASYISLRISLINQYINELSLEQQQTDSVDRIGFALPDIEILDDEFEDKKK